MQRVLLVLCLLLYSFASLSSQTQCLEADQASRLPGPTLTTKKIDSFTKKITGKINDYRKGDRILLCRKRSGQFLHADEHPVLEDGTFAVPVRDLEASDIVTLEVKDSNGAVGQPSAELRVSAQTNNAANGDYRYNLIVGVEEASFSSMGLNTNPFLQGYFESLKFGALGFMGWGRVRVLGSPQPSTGGVGSSFIDPSGTITKQDFTKIGTSIDVVAGVQRQFWPRFSDRKDSTGGASVIAAIGTTTPLSSQDVAFTFKDPDRSTLECQQLLARFTPANGYSPGLTANAPNGPNPTSCLVNGSVPVKDISFANQDRTNFLLKWGAGIRIFGVPEGTPQGKAGTVSTLDATIGQDANVTGGYVRHFVAKADGVLSVPHTDGFFYIFGSVYTRFSRNKNSSPLILSAETNKPTGPSPDVIVLPLRQPDRDFFRLGVGINLDRLIKTKSPENSKQDHKTD